MELTIGIYKLVGTVDDFEVKTNDEIIANNCGEFISASVFNVRNPNEFETDAVWRLLNTIVTERIELLRIYDEYLDSSQSETFKRDILDNFKDGMTIATLSWK